MQGASAEAPRMQDPYGIEEGTPANFGVLDSRAPFETARRRAEVLASRRHGDYLFKRPEPSDEIGLDLLGKAK